MLSSKERVMRINLRSVVRFVMLVAALLLFFANVSPAQDLRTEVQAMSALLREPGTVPPPAAPRFTAAPEATAAPFQNPVNPNIIEFAPSTDHNTQDAGVPRLTRYDIELMTVAAPTVVVKTWTIDKPVPATPANGGAITWNLLQTQMSGVAAGAYTVKVVAVGPGGSNRSAASNPFTQQPGPAASGTPVVR